MRNKTSTYGLILLGSMILTKFMVSPEPVKKMMAIGQIDELIDDGIKNDNYQTALAYIEGSSINNDSKLLASVSINDERTNHIFNEDINQNLFEELIIETNEITLNNVKEIINEEVSSSIVSMDSRNSSVTLILPIEPTEKIISKSDHGDYPLDGGNTISNSMNRIFPIQSDLEE